MDDKAYPKHIYEKIRSDIAVSIVQHEFRKLFNILPQEYFAEIKKAVAGWTASTQVGFPRDFWNGFHGIIMGFKLKIFLTYLITAENISWSLDELPLEKLTFGVEQGETRHIRPGKLPASEVREFYTMSENQEVKEKFIELNRKLSSETSPRDSDPIIAYQNEVDGQTVFSVHDGNRRLAKAAIEGKEKILTYIATYKSEDRTPRNYWIPTSLLMDNLYFARLAFEENKNDLFDKYMDILADMLSKSESAVYEMQNRALTSSQPFRDTVLSKLKLNK